MAWFWALVVVAALLWVFRDKVKKVAGGVIGGRRPDDSGPANKA